MKKHLILNEQNSDRLKTEVLSKLPALPAVIKYYDEFTEQYCSIDKVSEHEDLILTYGGFDMTLRLSRFSPSLSILLKHVLFEMNSREVNMHAIVVRITSVIHLTQDEIAEIAFSSPESIGPVWTRLLTEKRINTLVATKEILKVLCTNRIGGWSPSYAEYISKSLVLPPKDKYAFLRSGNAFLTVEQESLVVSLIDDACNLTKKSRDTLTLRDLNDVAMLICAFQFGMRPTQIARVKMGEVRHRISDSDGTTSVHISFPMIKQRRGARSPRLIRRVKPEWTSVFCEIIRRSAQNTAHPRFFNVLSGREAGFRITSFARRHLDSTMLSAKTFRHSAAQRMVDAGASHEELAAFLGHADLTSGLFYFQAAIAHGELINRALGLSPIYSELARVAHDRFISEEELARLKEDDQVAGVPHGLPISGIGGCSSGQPACPYNPVMSCYGCRRFMPLSDPGLHRAVLADLRSVVSLFNDSSRSEQESPAYLQLQRTISNVQSIIGELEGSWNE